MAGRTGITRTLVAWALVLLSAMVCLSLVWDADGNPNTDNLPPVALPMGAQPAADVEAGIDDNEETPSPVGGHPFLRLVRPVQLVRQRRWRRLALPPRGP